MAFGATLGLSTIPASSVGVLVIGDCAIEVNEADLEWSNVYDGDTYVCTRLRCVALSIVSNGALGDEANSISRLMNTIRSVISQSYTVTNPLYFRSQHGSPYISGMSPSVLSYAMSNTSPNESIPSSYYKDYAITGGLPSFFLGMSKQNFDLPTNKLSSPLAVAENAMVHNLHYLPPTNFAFFYKHGFHEPINVIPAVSNSDTTLRVGSCGLFIPGNLMYKPIEIELVSLDSNIGSDMCSLRIIVSVYFNISTYHDNYGLSNEPAYHKWSIATRWNVGKKPLIIVSGRVVRRALAYGAPSIYEYLPHSMPGTRLISLDVSTDDNSHATTYSAVYELDYICVSVGTQLLNQHTAMFISNPMAMALYSVAHFSIQEEAESVTQGSSFMQTLFETAIQKHSVDMNALYNMLGSVGKSLEGVSASVGNISDIKEKVGKVREKTPKNWNAKKVEEFMKNAASQIRSNVFSAIGSSLGGALNSAPAELSRVVQQNVIDSSALERAANGVVRTAHITVIGYPGATLDDLQVAAYTVAKQIYLGWVAISCPPAVSVGWRLYRLMEMANRDPTSIKDVIQKWRDNAPQKLEQSQMETLFHINPKLADIFRENQDLKVERDSETNNHNWYRELMSMFLTVAPRVRSYVEPRWLADSKEDQPAYGMFGYVPAQSIVGRFVTGTVQNATIFESLTKVDDIVGLLLTFMGIHSVKAHVFVDHMIPMVKLTLVVVFRSSDYNGLSLISSLYSNLTGLYLEMPVIPSQSGQDSILSPSWFIPAIVPLCSSQAFDHMRKYAHSYIVDSRTAQRPFQNVAASKNAYKLFHNLYVDIYRTDDENLLASATITAHVYNSIAKSMYAHGGSIGQGYQTPVIAPSYTWGHPYLPGIGAGVVMSHFNWVTTWSTYPVKQQQQQIETQLSARN